MAAPPATRTITLPEVPLNGRVVMAERELEVRGVSLAGEIATSAEIDLPVLFAATVLLGVLYSVKYLLVPLVKMLSPSGGSLIDRAVSWAISTLLAPVRYAFQAVINAVASGVDYHAPKITLWLHAQAFMVHDWAVELGNFAGSTADALTTMTTTTIPREINRVTAPLKTRVTRLETVRKRLDAIARKYGYADFPTLVLHATPAVKQLVAAEVYVKGQHHTSLAGALSVYEATSKSWKATEQAVRKLGYYTIPDFVKWAELEIHKTLPAKIQVEVKARKALQAKVQPLINHEPELLALLAPAGLEAAIRKIIPKVCTDVGECAATGLAGASNWGIFKGLLKLLLFGAIDLLVISELCTIAAGIRDAVNLAKPGLRAVAVVEGGLAAHGCAGKTPPLPPPAYH